jgi:tetratricopeptide (TPR) repeat protein
MYALLRSMHQAGEVFLLTHAAGISPDSGRVEMMLRRWVGELCGYLGEPDSFEDNSNPDETAQAFAGLLHRAAQRQRIVLLVDALNQFAPGKQTRHMTWLPQIWPENVRFLATATPGSQTKALAKLSGFKMRPLKPIDEQLAAKIAKTICEVYHRTLHNDVLQALCSKKRLWDGSPAFGNPQWLTMAVEELNLLDADDFARAEREFSGDGGQRLHQLLLQVVAEIPAEVEPLYYWVLNRAEYFWGEAWVRSFASLLAAGRYGWREIDLEALMPRLCNEAWDPLRFAGLRRSFRAHLMQRGEHGQWDFAYAHGRAAVLGRYLDEPEKSKELHKTIAEYLLGLSAEDPLHISETMHHLMQADDKERAAVYYGSELGDAEAAGASRVVASSILSYENKKQNYALEWLLGLLTISTVDVIQVALCIRLIHNLHDILKNTSLLDTRLALYKAAHKSLSVVSQSSSSPENWRRELSVSCARIGDTLKTQGDLSGALHFYKKCHDIIHILCQKQPSNFDWQSDLTASLFRIGDTHLAQGDATGALKAYRELYLRTKLLGQSSPTNKHWERNLAETYLKIGDFFQSRGYLAVALQPYKNSLAIMERLAESSPSDASWQRDLSVRHLRLGGRLQSQGELQTALHHYNKSLAIMDCLCQSDPSNKSWQCDLATCHGKVGDILKSQGDLPGTLQAYNKSLTTLDRLRQYDPTNQSWLRALSVAHKKVGHLLQEQNHLNMAFKAFWDAMVMAERLCQCDPTNANWKTDLAGIHIKLGDILHSQGSLTEALQSYSKSSAIMDKLCRSESPSPNWQLDHAICHNKVGDVRLALGDQPQALQRYKESMNIVERLYNNSPYNPSYLRGVYVSCCKVAQSMEKQGDPGSRQYYLRAYDMLSDMQKQGLHLSAKDTKSLELIAQKIGQ